MNKGGGKGGKAPVITITGYKERPGGKGKAMQIKVSGYGSRGPEGKGQGPSGKGARGKGKGPAGYTGREQAPERIPITQQPDYSASFESWEFGDYLWDIDMQCHQPNWDLSKYAEDLKAIKKLEPKSVDEFNDDDAWLDMLIGCDDLEIIWSETDDETQSEKNNSSNPEVTAMERGAEDFM